MKLPQELVEEIIGHLPPDDEESLRNCSVVAKSWVRPSQKRLFEAVRITPQNLQPWLDTISPTNLELLHHVRQLSYSGYPKGALEPVHRALRDYLPSLTQLRDFNFFYSHILSPPQQIALFSAFQHTLSIIRLESCHVTTNGFVTLINHFPNLSYLRIQTINHIREDEPATPLSRTIFKKLFVFVCLADTVVLLTELSNLGLCFEEVDMSNFLPKSTWPNFSKRIVELFGESAKCLRIRGTFKEDGRFLSLSHCRELRELEVMTMYLNDKELTLISSITSMHIQKIIFAYSPAFELPVDDFRWIQLDGILTNLVERSKYESRLEVAFCSATRVLDGSDLAKYLPRFVKKGRVTVLDHKYEMLCCSDGVQKRR